MRIIPVIDLKNGHVVHAQQGNRDFYRPLRSPLSQSSAIEAVIEAFLRLYPFTVFYLADLDAITRSGHHHDLIGTVLKAYPEVTFWVDGGFNLLPEQYVRFDNFLPVIGSESLRNSDLASLSGLNGKFILSLDFSGNQLLGAGDIFVNHKLWPATVIIMTLGQIGTDRGPDFDRLAAYRQRFGEKDFVAAGGIRNKQDLTHLQQTGIHHALIASALHSGAITASDIEALN